MASDDDLPEGDDNEPGAQPPASLSFDDLQGMGAAPVESPPTSLSRRQLEDMGAEDFTPSKMGTALRSAALNTIPSLAGGVMGVAGGSVGAAGGALTAPVTGPVGAGVGAIGGGVGGAMLGSWLARKGEDYVLDMLGLGKTVRQYETADKLENPMTEFGAGLAPAALSFGVGGAGTTLAQRGLGAGIQGGTEAAQELYNGEGLDPKKLALAAGAGATFAHPRGWIDKTLGRPSGGGNAPQQPGAGPRAPGGPPEAPLNGEIIPPDQGSLAYDPGAKYGAEYENYKSQRDGFDTHDPMWKFWNDHMEQLQSREDGKGGLDVDASLGPHSEDNPFTYQDSNRANDTTTVASGVAHENGPAPQIEGAGNPVGSPMQGRIAARPTEPGRNYGKGADTSQRQISAQESTPVSQAPIHEDISAALKAQQPEAPPVQGQDVANGVGSRSPGVDATSQLPSPAPPPKGAAETQAPAQAAAQGQEVANATPWYHGSIDSQSPRSDYWTSNLEKARTYAGPRGFVHVADEHAFPVASLSTRQGDVLSNKRFVPGGPFEVPKIATRGSLPSRSTDAEFQQLLAAPQGQKVAPENQPAPPRAPGKPVTAPVTEPLAPQEQRVLDHAMDALNQAGMSRVIEKLQALPPKDAAIAATKILTAMQSKTGEATAAGSAGDVRLPGKRPEVAGLGVMGRSKADVARKQGVLDAYDQAVKEFGTPADDEKRGQLLDRLSKMVRRADELAAGRTYSPNVKPASWQLISAARLALSKQTPKSIEAYQQKEAGLKGASLENAKDFQQTNRIDSDRAYKPQLPEAAEENNAARGEPETQRPEHETFENVNREESAVYTGQHNQLTNWLNNLSDASHSMVLKEHPDLVTNVKTTQDPAALYRELQNDLANAQRKAAMFEAVPGENAPVVKRTPIHTRDELAATEPAKEPARPASAGKSLKGSPEFAALAAKYANAAPKKAQYDLAHEEQRAVDGSDQSFYDAAKKFMSDESGAGVPLTDLVDWLQTKTKSFFHPRADQAVLDYGTQIGMRGTKLRTDISGVKAEAIANARASAEFKGPNGADITTGEKGNLYRALEDGTVDQLPQHMQDYYHQFWEKPLEQAGRAYDELRDLSIQNKLPGYEEMPERKSNGDGFMNWMPRRQLRMGDNDDFDPITNKSGLSHWTPSAMERDWFTLKNLDTGDRYVYRVNDDGKIVFYKNGKGGPAKNLPSSFDPRDIGAEVKLGNNVMKVDHATIDELMQHGAGDKGEPLKYSDNPGYVISDSLIGLKSALYRTRLLDRILNDPEFSAMSAMGKAKADAAFGKGNHIETILPQLAGRRMLPPVAWALDDLVKTGFNYGDGPVGRALDKAAQFAQATLKPFYFFGPAVHVLNELDKFMTLSGTNLPRNMSNLRDSVKSVWSQDATQKEILAAGGNPMYMHVFAQRAMPQIAKLVGEDAAKNPWKYDPLNKAFGIDTKDMMSAMYQGSNKLMWWQSDVLYTAVYKGFRQKGMSSEEAVKNTEHVIDSYVVPTTMGKSIGLEGSGAGRLLQQALTDPLFANFGRFHYGLYSALANVVKNTVAGLKGDAGKGAMGAAQVALMLGMYNFGYPALSAAYQKLTGNKHSEFELRGTTKLASLPFRIAKQEKDPADIARQLWTPSTVADTLISLSKNKDFAGRPIVQGPGKYAPGQLAEFGAKQFVSPLAAITSGLNEGGPGTAMRKFAESNLGLKTPSPGAARYADQREKKQASEMKTRLKNPRGGIERLWDELVK